MSPENVVAALGILIGDGKVLVRTRDDVVTEIRLDLLLNADGERRMLDIDNLFLLLDAEEVL